MIMQIKTDIERYRVRRTLSEVTRKLEEALRLSQQIKGEVPPDQTEKQNAETATHRHR